MKTTFTPGPWRLNRGAVLTVEADGHVGPIAELRSRLDFAGMDPRVAETREANARLVEAAPNLFDVLRDCFEYLDCIPESAVGGDDEAVALARRARAALEAAAGIY